MITKPEKQILQELREQRPSQPAALLSEEERHRLIERGMAGLYRWYVSRSQATRNWNPDQSFDWRNIRRDHSPEINRVIEGFFAVEQYVPDYTSSILGLVRRSHGRSHFTLRWGAEEEKHSDTWQNALMFIGNRSPDWVRGYMDILRNDAWRLQFDDPLTMTAYVVVQERATQVNYLNTLLVAEGKNPDYLDDADPVLAQISKTIAIDEAAHYAFFQEVFKLYLYYFPEKAIDSLWTVIDNFAMPADEYIPDFESFAEALVKTSIYGPKDFYRDVLQFVLTNLGMKSRRALEKGIKQTREVPDPQGKMFSSAFWDGFSYFEIEQGIERLFGKVQRYEAEIGLDEIDPIPFVRSGLLELDEVSKEL